MKTLFWRVKYRLSVLVFGQKWNEKRNRKFCEDFERTLDLRWTRRRRYWLFVHGLLDESGI